MYSTRSIKPVFAHLPLIGRHDGRVARGHACAEGLRMASRRKASFAVTEEPSVSCNCASVNLGQVGAARGLAAPEWQALQPRLAKRRSPFCASDAPLVLPAVHFW